jgi:hypothetical protein
MKGVLILASVVMLAGCSFYDVKERVNNGWKVVTNPNSYRYEIHEDGSVTTYIELIGDR